MTRKVLFLLHGGTISQLEHQDDQGNKYLVPAIDPELFTKACAGILNRFSGELDITTDFITTKDSSNMRPEDWTRLALRIKKAQNEEDYQGVVVTHGTDTLSYTAAAISLALHGSNPNGSSLRIPVCITGSQKSIYAQGTDAYHNLYYAFKTVSQASEEGIADVLVNFDKEVMLGVRAIKISEVDFNAFASPNYPNIGHIKQQKLLMSRSLVNTQDRFLPTSNDLVHFAHEILSIDLTPGLDPKVIETVIDSGLIKAVIFRTFAAGNLPSDAHNNLIPVVEKAVSLNIPVFLTSKVAAANASGADYEPGMKALEAGAIPCFDQSEAVVAVKIAWLIGNNLCRTVADFNEAMRTNYVGELSSSSQEPFEDF
jgi:L-asparaginase